MSLFRFGATRSGDESNERAKKPPLSNETPESSSGYSAAFTFSSCGVRLDASKRRVSAFARVISSDHGAEASAPRTRDKPANPSAEQRSRRTRVSTRRVVFSCAPAPRPLLRRARSSRPACRVPREPDPEVLDTSIRRLSARIFPKTCSSIILARFPEPCATDASPNASASSSASLEFRGERETGGGGGGQRAVSVGSGERDADSLAGR